ncbi:MAG: hypothetical protein ACLRQF_21185 [Thomasclavelia ramosa]
MCPTNAVDIEDCKKKINNVNMPFLDVFMFANHVRKNNNQEYQTFAESFSKNL